MTALRTALSTIAAALLVMAFAAQSVAAKRVALVIGNAVYAHAPRLANPLNDANDIGAALGRLGFKVTRLENADQIALQRGLKLFARAASAAEAAVVFYAGHGIEVGGRNFLVPVDARLLSDREVEFETVSLELVSRAVESASGLGMVILDACRDNPFAAAMKRAGAKRSIGRGLARIEPSGEMLVAYAAKGGTVASDGQGRNSPYSTALLRHLEEPGLEIGLMFRKVRDAVLQDTRGKQEPFIYGSLSSEGFYLAGRLAAPGPQAPAKPPQGGAGASRDQLAARAYEAAERLNTVEAYEAVARRFAGTIYAELAHGQIRKLKGAGTQADPAEADQAALGLTVRDRRAIQAGLAAAGFNAGPADGVFGPATRLALKAWQKKAGQAATGRLTAASASTLKALGRQAMAGAATTAGKTFRDCAGCPVMVAVPAGSFTMGSPSHEAGRKKWEGPRHRVTISKPLAVGKYEVTRAEFARFVAATGHATGNSCWTYEGKWKERSDRGWRNPGFGQSGRDPVTCVSWNDAQQYVRWLSRRTGQRYRLLSASEWEYAARAGTRTRYHWGDSVGRNRANCDGCGSRWDKRRTAPVGSFAANRFGLHDLHGNVWEWVEDCWHGNYRGAPSDGNAWTTGGTCYQRVLRGGSWNNHPGILRAAYRIRNSAGIRSNNFGFRVARTLSP